MNAVSLHEHLPDFEAWRHELQQAREKVKHPDLPFNLVLYTDGGCRPAPRGVGGWGIFGYVYLDVKPKQGHGCKGFIPTSQGLRNVAPGDAKSDEVSVLCYIDGCGALPKPSTNNAAEASAMRYALEVIAKLKPANVMFRCDSEYVLNGCREWIYGWDKKQWKNAEGQPIANQGIWMRIHALITTMPSGTALEWRWVKGHKDSVGNTQADHNATKAVFQGHNEHFDHVVTWSSPKDYWTPVVERPRFLSDACWYFITGGSMTPSFHGRYLFHLGNHGPDDDSLGKPIADTSMAVVALTDPDPVLTRLLEHQNALAEGLYGTVVVARLDNIFKPRVYASIKGQGVLHLHKPTYRADLSTPSGVVVTREKDPPGLAYRAVDELTRLQNILDRVVLGKVGLEADDQFILTDITAVIYEETQVKNETVLKVRLDQSADNAAIKTAVQYARGKEMATTPVALTVGQDTPKRNFFAAIAGAKPKVYVVTWPEPNSTVAIRVATYIVTEKDCGIWAGAYSNLWIVAR